MNKCGFAVKVIRMKIFNGFLDQTAVQTEMNIPIPEPASFALLLMGTLLLGTGRARH